MRASESQQAHSAVARGDTHAEDAPATMTAGSLGQVVRAGNAPRVADTLGDDPDELFDLVDREDRVIGQVRRGEAHRDPALIHRSVQVLVFGGDGQLLLQRRSRTKDLFPGYYCASASGHVLSGEAYAATAEREVAEELGVALRLRPLGKTLVCSEPETEMTALFVATSDGPFVFSPTETDGGLFVPLAELRARRDDPALPLTPALHAALDMLAALEPLDPLGKVGAVDQPAGGEEETREGRDEERVGRDYTAQGAWRDGD